MFPTNPNNLSSQVNFHINGKGPESKVPLGLNMRLQVELRLERRENEASREREAAHAREKLVRY